MPMIGRSYSPASYFTIFLALFIGCLFGCQNTEKELVIGFSQCTTSDLWRKTMQDDMQRELSFYEGVRLVIKDAQDNNEKQIQHINEFIDEGVDLLIVSPNEAEPLTPHIEKAYRQGIPVLVIDRETTSNLYTAFVGADNFEIGKTAAEFALESFGQDTVRILEIWGLKGSTPAIDRHAGFYEQLMQHPGYQIVASVDGEWQYEKAKERLKPLLDTLKVDLVFAHNDQMGKAAHDVLMTNKKRKGVRIYGVDGLPGSGGGLEMVANGVLNATFLYPTGGEEAIRIAMDVLNGRPVKKDNVLLTTAIHDGNVRTLNLQAEKILSQQQSITRQQQLIASQNQLYQSQRNILYIVSGCLALILLLSVFLFMSLAARRRINESLKQKRKEAERATEQVKEANEAKLRFFTNISHEFRTPLTLILAPIEEMMKHTSRPLREKQELTMVYNNARRLLRLVSQLMDFRKIESNKLKVQAAPHDLVIFIRNIVDAFKSMAERRHIDLQFRHPSPPVAIWFDSNMLDKVLFNLLSNAFNFTADGGFIHVSVTENPSEVVIDIEDNGSGMSEEHVQHAFDRFYVGENYQGKGTGLGLAFSKELVALHGGSINVLSKKHEGTKFTIALRKGRGHFDKAQLTTTTAGYHPDHYLPDEGSLTDPQTSVSDDNRSTILVVEDDDELRAFLVRSLSANFNVITAPAGIEGIKQAQEHIPDLIITDLSLPDLDGFGVVRKVKSDIRTSHIPVVMLTSRDQESNQLEGLKAGAEMYITKPFSLSLLLEGIRSQLRNREMIKRHYGIGGSDDEAPVGEGLNKQFINSFRQLINSNLSNPELNVEAIGEELGMSRVQLYRKVKGTLGCSVHEYLHEARLARAKEMLRNSGSTVAEVAYESGFSSPAYFSTVFKTRYKISPSEYRNR